MTDERLDVLLEEYLASTGRPKKPRWQWVKPLLAAVCTVIGTSSGAGWAARGYLSQLYTKEDARQQRLQDEAAGKDRAAHETEQDRRIGVTESTAATADKCCAIQSARLDRILTPRNER